MRTITILFVAILVVTEGCASEGNLLGCWDSFDRDTGERTELEFLDDNSLFEDGTMIKKKVYFDDDLGIKTFITERQEYTYSIPNTGIIKAKKKENSILSSVMCKVAECEASSRYEINDQGRLIIYGGTKPKVYMRCPPVDKRMNREIVKIITNTPNASVSISNNISVSAPTFIQLHGADVQVTLSAPCHETIKVKISNTNNGKSIFPVHLPFTSGNNCAPPNKLTDGVDEIIDGDFTYLTIEKNIPEWIVNKLIDRLSTKGTSLAPDEILIMADPIDFNRTNLIGVTSELIVSDYFTASLSDILMAYSAEESLTLMFRNGTARTVPIELPEEALEGLVKAINQGVIRSQHKSET